MIFFVQLQENGRWCAWPIMHGIPRVGYRLAHVGYGRTREAAVFDARRS